MIIMINNDNDDNDNSDNKQHRYTLIPTQKQARQRHRARGGPPPCSPW